MIHGRGQGRQWTPEGDWRQEPVKAGGGRRAAIDLAAGTGLLRAVNCVNMKHDYNINKKIHIPAAVEPIVSASLGYREEDDE